MSEELTTIRSRRVTELAPVSLLFNDELFPVLQEGSAKRASIGDVVTHMKKQDFSTWVYQNSAPTQLSYTWVQQNSAFEKNATTWVQGISSSTQQTINTVNVSAQNWKFAYDFVADNILTSGLSSNYLAENSVQTNIILNRSITPEKLSLGAMGWDYTTKTSYLTSTDNFYIRADLNKDSNIYLNDNNLSHNAILRYPGTQALKLSAGVGNIQLITQGSGDLEFYAGGNNAARMAIDGTTGKVFFKTNVDFDPGTILKVDQLDVKNIIFQTGGAFDFATVVLSSIKIQQGNGLEFTYTDLVGNNITSYGWYLTGTDFRNIHLYDKVFNQSRIFVDSGGQVGLGTMVPAARLDVFGDIRGGELILKRRAANPNDTASNTSDVRGARIRMARSLDNASAYDIDVDGLNNNQSFRIYDVLNNKVRFQINANGNVGIDTTPGVSDKLSINGSLNCGAITSNNVIINDNITIPNNSAYRSKSTSNADIEVLKLNNNNYTIIKGEQFTLEKFDGTDLVTIDNNGNLTAKADLIAFSDQMLKTNITSIENALDKLKQLNGVEFNRIDSGKRSIGLIAQQVENVIPEVVATDENGIKGIAYGNLVGLLIEAIKELSNEIKQLKK